MSDSICPFCGNKFKEIQHTSHEYEYWVECVTCGEYITNHIVFITYKYPLENGWIASAKIRDYNMYPQEQTMKITPENIEYLLSPVGVPQNLLDKMDRILIYLSKKTEQFGESFEINARIDYPIAFAKNEKEMQAMINQYQNMGYIKKDSSISDRGFYILSFDGWKRIDELRRIKPLVGNKCFVAMSFHPSLNDVYNNGILPAVGESGYDPIRIDKTEHLNKVDDEIISKIRESRIMVADFTGHRGGVYFEAGFAMGLGIPVIWTCKKEDLVELHFDTRQYNFIDWESIENLKERLKNRILATVPFKR